MAPNQSVKILTCYKQGLVRSVGLTDVLKMHFEPVDVIPVGLTSNSRDTLVMLFTWTDWVICMDNKRYLQACALAEKNGWADPQEIKNKILVCDVGQDIYGNSHNPILIDQCWRWCRSMASTLGIQEHFRSI